MRKLPSGHWTLQRCREKWTQCSSISDFRKKHPGAYEAVYRRGWLHQLQESFPNRYVKGKWDKASCSTVILACKTIEELKRRFPGAYSATLKSNWKSLLYERFQDSPIRGKYTLEGCRLLWRKYTNIRDFDRAHPAAYSAIKRYGWTAELRKDFPGAKKQKYTLEDCRLIWRTCISIKQFKEKSVGAYSAVKKNGWLGELRKDLKPLVDHGKWGDLKQTRSIWVKFPSISSFYRAHPGAQAAIVRNGWAKKIRSDFPKSKKINGYWTKARCTAAWKSCKNISEFAVLHGAAYSSVKKNGWLKELHIDLPPRLIHGQFNDLSLCKSLWKQCYCVAEFIQKHHGAYEAVKRNGWVDEMYQDLPPIPTFTDNDAIYIWRTGLTYRKKPIYKVGVTSYRLGTRRLSIVAKKHNTDFTILRLVKCSDAISIEKVIRKAVNKVTHLTGDGVTEMFFASVEEINATLDLFDRLVLENAADTNFVA